MDLIMPNDWAELLARIQTVAPEALLGGGALRDLENGRSVNDLDIFVEEGSHLPEVISEIVKTHPNLTREVGDAYLTWDTTVQHIWVFETEDGSIPPVNLISLYWGNCTVEEQLSRFDFGICRIIFDGRAIHRCHTYLRDQKDQTFTLLRHGTEDQNDCSFKRYDRLVLKYPGWRLVETKPRLADCDFSF